MEKKITGCYTTVAVIVFNTLLFLIGINMLLGLVVYPLLDFATGRNTPAFGIQTQSIETPSFSAEELAAAYPDWSIEDRTLLLNETWTRAYRCAQYVHFMEAAYNGEYVNVHPVGFRYNHLDQTWQPPDNAFVIFVFGGSTTFGYGIADNETIPARIEQQLQTLDTQQDIVVYNFGQGWYFSAQELRLLENLLQDGYRPDMVILIDGLNETTRRGIVERPQGWDAQCLGEGSQPTQVLGTLANIRLPADRLLDSVRYRVFDQQIGVEQAQQEPLSAQQIVDLYLTNQQAVQALGKQFGFETVFVWQPIPMYEYDLRYHTLWRDGLGDIATQTYELMNLARSEVQVENFLWLADMQQSRPELLYVDRVHYNANFAADIATAIVNNLQDKSLLLETVP